MKKYHYIYCILLLSFILGSHNGYVALWQTGSDQPRVFPVRVSILPPADQAKLEEGIYIDSKEELMGYMEDFLS